MQIEACASSSECVGGGSCVPLSQLAGDAGLGGDAGGLPAGAGMYASMLGMEMACVPPAGTPVDSGTDAPTEAAAPVDAGTDAPAEAAPAN